MTSPWRGNLATAVRHPDAQVVDLVDETGYVIAHAVHTPAAERLARAANQYREGLEAFERQETRVICGCGKILRPGAGATTHTICTECEQEYERVLELEADELGQDA